MLVAAHEGLRHFQGASELAVLVEQQRGAEALFPRDGAGFLASFYRFAERGEYIEIGDFTVLNDGAPRLLGRFAGSVCVPMSTDILPAYQLLVLLTAREIEVGRRFGAQRIIATLGAQYRRFPTLPWAPRERAEIPLGDGSEDTSLLARLPVGRPPRLYAVLVSDGIVGLPIDQAAVPGDTQVTGTRPGRCGALRRALGQDRGARRAGGVGTAGGRAARRDRRIRAAAARSERVSAAASGGLARGVARARSAARAGRHPRPGVAQGALSRRRRLSAR